MSAPAMILAPRTPSLEMIASGFNAGFHPADIWAAMIVAWESSQPRATSAYLNRPPRSPAEAIAAPATALIGRTSHDADACRDPDDDQDEDDPPPDDTELPDLGPCCLCDGRRGVRNIIMLDRRCAVPGHDWAAMSAACRRTAPMRCCAILASRAGSKTKPC